MFKKKDENKVILVKKIQCHPTKEQIEQLEHDSFWCRILYNTYLSQRKEIYDYTGESIKMSEQRNQIIKLREDNSEYAKIYAKHLHAVCMDLDDDYKRCIKKRAKGEKCKLPRYKDKNYWYSLKTQKQYVKIKENAIKLGLYELEVNTAEVPESYGEVWITKVRDKKKKDSRRYKRLTQKLNKMYEKRRKQQEHFIHSITKYIVIYNKTIVIGDLSQEQMIKNLDIKKLNRSIKENWGLGKFRTHLAYKAKLHDVQIVEINEAYTSKTCSNCGIKHQMSLSNRTYKCECGMIIDRDINSAINIFNRYKKNQELSYKNISQVTTLYFQGGKLVV